MHKPITKNKLLTILFSFAMLGNPALAEDSGESSSESFGEAVGVALQTSAGTIEIDVYPQAAPISAGDFLKYVDEGMYTDAAFYRVVRPDNDKGNPMIEVIQGGLVDTREALPTVEHETTEQTGILHTDGTISLARGAPGSGGGAAFFITLGNQPSLDFGGMRNPDGLGFAAFGRVTSGMEIVREIQQMESTAPVETDYVKDQILTERVIIKRAYRLSPKQ